MFLRSLTLRGFKSFADKTTLEFRPGISVIVGPNGSGKSNVVDAIAWVLGEQGPRALRGGQMTDVIFAGTPSKPGLGMAEVRMVIDNTAGLIPVPASEIEISRAIFRSGESEYRLGGRPVRLMDIQELLSDTGMGRAQHTIVGQGQLDSVLSARPEERRQFIEEAAGIAKHRRRRERAERKLAGLDGDLNRLQDLVGELRRQLKPLKQQAELAGRHEALTAEAAELTMKLAAARLRDLQADRARRAPAWADMESKEAEANQRLADLDSEIARLDGERALAEARQRDAEELHQSTLEAKSNADEALRQGIREESRARERLAQAENRSGRLFALEDELERTRSALAEVGSTLAGRERELELAEAEFRAASSARRDAEDQRRRAGEELAVRRAETEALGRALAGHDAELGRLGSALEELRAQSARAEARVGELSAEVERLDAVAAPLAERAGELERLRQELAARVSGLEAEEQGLVARQEVVDARHQELSESPGAAFLRRRGGRAVGLLRDLIEAPPDLWPAIRGALGAHVDALVYADRDDAIADAEHAGPGAVTLAVEHDAPLMPAAIHTERRLIEAVRFDPRARGLVVSLLGEVYLVGNLAEASAKHRVHPYACFVTRDGQVVGPSVVRTAPGADARLEEVRRQSAAIERELAAVRRGLREGRRDSAETVRSLEGIRSDLDENDRLLTAAAEEQAAFAAELTARRREEQLVGEREAAVRAAAESARERLAAVAATEPSASPPTLPPMPEPPISLRVDVEALRRDLARLEAAVVRTGAEVEALAAEDPVRLRDVVRAAEAARAVAEEALRDAEGHLAGALAAYRTTTEAARAVQARHAEANRAWREGSAAMEALRRDHEEEGRNRHDLERRVVDAERLLREGHRADPVEAVASLGADDTVEELQRRSDLVARRLGLLGRVNLLAVGELDALQERHDFMVRELEDVRAARRDLEEVIRQVDLRMVELFGEAFRDVAREFAALFQTMFPGGEGRLILLDPDDPLGSGIEVEARPGRGRVKRLSLLSGGERSLAALAFLFAIFRARPSPFYLMDEVEAALDDVNLHRFLEVVREFAATSQIMVVTHQKRTMEMADVLYGVSMGREGVSRVLSQRLAEVVTTT
jgi:chromosome segregation protein